MCGILYARLQEENAEFATVFKDAIHLMAYRGRDAIGFYQTGNHYFGHARLSILDLSSRSNQPMVNKNNIILFKGEIYNYKHLVKNAFSDTLAVAKLIEEGVDIADKLCGMYALLSYDKHTEKVRVFRDFYGEKPVYFYVDDKVFIVSSTIKAIIFILQNTFAIKLKLNSLALYEYLLCGYVREPQTIYENIQVLSSGHELIFSFDWKYTLQNHISNLIKNTPFNTHEHTEHCLKSTDVEPALLLSSGVDSTYLLDQMQNTCDVFRILTYKAHTSVLDESHTALNNVKMICKNKNIKTEILENHDDIVKLYEDYPNILEQPTSDGMNLFNILSVSRAQDPSLKLIIMGTGGDELYGGYPSFSNYRLASILRRFSYFERFLPNKYKRFFHFKNNTKIAVESYYFLYRLCPHFLPHLSRSVLQQLFETFVSEMKKYALDEYEYPYKKIKRFESFDYMRNQLLRDTDNISLYLGYEARNPILAIPAYAVNPDFKRSMKTELQTKYGITFTKKRGFTFYEKEQTVARFLQKKIKLYNQKFNLLSKSTENNLLENNLTNYFLLRKIYNLLAWFEVNQIVDIQLQGFRI